MQYDGIIIVKMDDFTKAKADNREICGYFTIRKLILKQQNQLINQ